MPAIDDEQLGSPAEPGECPVLLLESVARPRQNRDSHSLAGNYLFKLPRDDLADRKPSLKRYSLSARFTHDDQINVVRARLVGKLIAQTNGLGRRRQSAGRTPA